MECGTSDCDFKALRQVTEEHIDVLGGCRYNVQQPENAMDRHAPQSAPSMGREGGAHSSNAVQAELHFVCNFSLHSAAFCGFPQLS
jgi:hypothetical protein